MRNHIFFVSSASPGYAVNVYQVAFALARPDRPVHILAHSRSQAERWHRSSGHPPSSNITLDILADGRWENWTPSTRDQAARFLVSNDFAMAVDACLRFNEDVFPGEHLAALIYSPAMAPMSVIAGRRGVKPYLLMTTPHYYTRLGGCHIEGEPLSTAYSLHGIGRSDMPLEVELNDVSDLTTRSYYGSVKPTMDHCAGIIYAHSNTGLEGEEFEQPHLPAPHYAMKPIWMIGPCLPRWFEDAIEDPWGRDKHMLELEERGECLAFLHGQDKASVVYVSLGSTSELHERLVPAIVEGLRRHGLRWILVLPRGSEWLKGKLADAADGVVTDWAPRLEILTHPAIECIIGHGSLSTMIETILAGKCIINCPVEADQHLNAKVMAHLGISVGNVCMDTLSINPDNAVDHVQRLLKHLFATDEGKLKLQQAKASTLALRKRIKGAKARNGHLQTEALCRDIALSKATEEDGFGDASQRLFPSFVLGPW